MNRNLIFAVIALAVVAVAAIAMTVRTPHEVVDCGKQSC